MKKLLLLSLLFILSFTAIYAQNIPKFEITKEGIDPIVVKVDSLKSNVLYEKTLEWVNSAFKNPKEVIVGDIKNKSLRISGYEKSAYDYGGAFGTTFKGDIEFQILLDFKDNKYRMEIKFIKLYDYTGSVYNFKPSSYYKKSGEIKKRHKKEKQGLTDFANRYSKMINDYIANKDYKDKW
jgi:hypothetical protein